MTTIILDGNYIFHKTFGIFSGFGKKDPGDVLSTEGETNMFVRKVITDLAYALNQIPDINRVIFCKDSRSWRKDFEISRSVYKENRTKSEGVDWGSFFRVMDEFGKYLEDKGYIYSTQNGAEGDDLLWIWANRIIEEGDNVIAISGDKDLHQIVKVSGDNWIGVWNNNSKNNKLVVPVGWSPEKKATPSIFDVDPISGSGDGKLKKLLSSCEVIEIDVKELVFKKILTGDKKDDVPGVYPHTLKSGRNSNIAEGKANKIWDLYLETEWKDLSMDQLWENEEFLEWIAGVSLRLLKQTDNQENREKFKQYYFENGTLVWLSEKTIPGDLIESVDSKIGPSLEEAKSPVINKKDLLESSPWSGTGNAPKEFDPFKLFE